MWSQQQGQGYGQPVLPPPGPGTAGPSGGYGPQGGAGYPPQALQGGFNNAWRGQGGGFGPPGVPGSAGVGGFSGGSGGYGQGGRMQGIAGPTVSSRPLGASSGPPKSLHLFQKTLRDMITGMRQHKNPAEQQRFLQKCTAEMREEARSGGFLR